MKYALVTGGTSGLGKTLTIKLIDAGYIVIASFFSNHVEAEKLEDMFNKSDIKKVFTIQHDLSQLDKIDQFVDKILAISTKIDLIIFNAGATDRTLLGDILIENWVNVFNVNLNVPVFVLQKLLNNLNKNSNIIFISSVMSTYPHSLSLSYGVSKSAINSLVSNLVKFLVPYSIRVNSIIPGFIETEWHNAKPAEQLNSIKSKISLGHFCNPEHISDFVLSVVKNPYINGQSLTIDGGYNFK